ncbi:hypothetical protein, partial [Escherichia coli]|uniref:hypothetical protein n=1 Tax=Escherichia coli TaxID=562 RepID=UPI001BC8A01F
WKGWAILLRQKQKKLIMLPSETMIWQPEFTDKTLSRKPGAVHFVGPTAFYSSSFCPTDATALWFASSRISAPTQAQLTGCNVCTSPDLKRQLSGF